MAARLLEAESAVVTVPWRRLIDTVLDAPGERLSGSGEMVSRPDRALWPGCEEGLVTMMPEGVLAAVGQVCAWEATAAAHPTGIVK